MSPADAIVHIVAALARHDALPPDARLDVQAPLDRSTLQFIRSTALKAVPPGTLERLQAIVRDTAVSA